VGRLAADLLNAGCDVIFDQWHNVSVGASIARFVERAGKSQFVIVVGTRRYLEKYKTNENILAPGSVLAGRADIVNQRLLGSEAQKRSILPILREGEAENALPVLARGRVYGDFRNETHYFVALFDLILTMVGVGFDMPGIIELRETLKSAAAKLESVGIAPTDADRNSEGVATA
jgi:hypothetical protein